MPIGEGSVGSTVLVEDTKQQPQQQPGGTCAEAPPRFENDKLLVSLGRTMASWFSDDGAFNMILPTVIRGKLPKKKYYDAHGKLVIEVDEIDANSDAYECKGARHILVYSRGTLGRKGAMATLAALASVPCYVVQGEIYKGGKGVPIEFALYPSITYRPDTESVVLSYWTNISLQPKKREKSQTQKKGTTVVVDPKSLSGATGAQPNITTYTDGFISGSTQDQNKKPSFKVTGLLDDHFRKDRETHLQLMVTLGQQIYVSESPGGPLFPILVFNPPQVILDETSAIMIDQYPELRIDHNFFDDDPLNISTHITTPDGTEEGDLDDLFKITAPRMLGVGTPQGSGTTVLKETGTSEKGSKVTGKTMLKQGSKETQLREAIPTAKRKLHLFMAEVEGEKEKGGRGLFVVNDLNKKGKMRDFFMITDDCFFEMDGTGHINYPAVECPPYDKDELLVASNVLYQHNHCTDGFGIDIIEGAKRKQGYSGPLFFRQKLGQECGKGCDDEERTCEFWQGWLAFDLRKTYQRQGRDGLGGKGRWVPVIPIKRYFSYPPYTPPGTPPSDGRDPPSVPTGDSGGGTIPTGSSAPVQDKPSTQSSAGGIVVTGQFGGVIDPKSMYVRFDTIVGYITFPIMSDAPSRGGGGTISGGGNVGGGSGGMPQP